MFHLSNISYYVWYSRKEFDGHVVQSILCCVKCIDVCVKSQPASCHRNGLGSELLHCISLTWQNYRISMKS